MTFGKQIWKMIAAFGKEVWKWTVAFGKASKCIVAFGKEVWQETLWMAHLIKEAWLNTMFCFDNWRSIVGTSGY
jgi:hypothetical protein